MIICKSRIQKLQKLQDFLTILAATHLLFKIVIDLKIKNFKTLWPLFMMGLNCLKARAASRRQLNFYH